MSYLTARAFQPLDPNAKSNVDDLIVRYKANPVSENVGKANQPKPGKKVIMTTNPSGGAVGTAIGMTNALGNGGAKGGGNMVGSLTGVAVGGGSKPKSEEDDPIKQYADLLSKGNSSVPDLMAAFKTNNEQAMKQSQTLSNNVYSKVNDLTALYKDLYNDQKTYNPLEADWAKQLLNYYGIESGEAADNARAGGAADNAGNIDSYAAANAERQRLSKLNAGVNSISGMSQNRFNNMLSTLQSIGVDTTNLFGVEQKNTQAALENAGKAGDLAVSEGETQTAADLQNNQILADLYAALYGGGTAEGEDSGHDYAKNPPSAEDTRAAITDLVESGAYDINDIDGIVEHMTKNYPDFSNWEGYIRSIHKRMVPNMEEPTNQK